MVLSCRAAGVAVFLALLALVGCSTNDGIPATVALGSDSVPADQGTDGTSGDGADDPDWEGDTVGGNSDSGATEEGVETVGTEPTDPGDGASADEPVYVSGSAAPWDSPAGMIAAMATDLPFREPPGTTISSVSVVVAADQAGSWQVSIDVRATAEMSSDELYELISEYPMFPRELETLSVPSDGDFGGWHRTISMSSNPDFTPVRSLAEVSLWISGTASADENAVLSNDLAAPVRELVDTFGPAFARRSELTWRPATPDAIEARVWLSNTVEDRLSVASLVGERAVPATYEARGDRVQATLLGGGEVLADWQPGQDADELELILTYPIDDGRPVLDDTLVAPTSPDRVTVVDWQEPWHVDEDGEVDPGWNTVDFNQSPWRRTGAPFHRQEDDRLPGAIIGTPDNGMTTWFRHTVNIADPAAFESLIVDAFADDGLVIWVNGIELHRWNVPAGPVQPSSSAFERISGLEELLLRRAAGLPTTALVPGDNLIAVAVYQASPESSDTRFDLRLSAITE